MIKTIICIAPVGQQLDATVFDYGYSLGACRDAHLTFVGVAPKIRVPSGMLVPQVRSLLSQANAERKKSAEVSLDSALRMGGVAARSVLVHDYYPATMDRILRLSRPSDLIIVTNTPDPLLGDCELVQRLLFGTGRPVLLLPAHWTRPAETRRVVVAWDGGAKAARAVGDALPLISSAEHVDVVCVGPELGKTLNGGDLASHLSRHCKSVTVVEMPPATDGVGQTIQAHAALTRADLIVMGAYGHSRLSEFILGGATRHALEYAQIPTMLSY